MSLLGSVRDMIASASTTSAEEENNIQREEDAVSEVVSVVDSACCGNSNSTDSVLLNNLLEKESASKEADETATTIDENFYDTDTVSEERGPPTNNNKPSQAQPPPSTSWLHVPEEPQDESLTMQVTTSNTKTKQWIDQWTRAGLSDYVSLPMICVLGDTSSGKSSVLSSLVGVELPSASTLTTKCPVLVQLQKSSGIQSKATVTIQWHKKTGPRSRKRTIEKNHAAAATLARIEQRVEDGRRTSPRKQRAPSEDEGSSHSCSSITSTESPPPPLWRPGVVAENLERELPKLIREAQNLILGYRRDAVVAPDTICVALESPGCREELTLVDLPGLVQFQHHHEASLLAEVERLVLDYAKNPRSILLPVVAAPSHIHNSRVLQWALELDPRGARTIPVLTKPDLVDPGSEPGVVDLLQPMASAGKSQQHQQQHQQFGHGFYMVKNRGQALLDRGASIADGLADEADYFRQTIPWNALAQQHRLGISNLRKQLAAVLWKLMEDSLPSILRELEQDYTETRTRLEALGPMYATSSDRRKLYHELSRQLLARVQGDLSGRGSRRPGNATDTTKPKPSGAARLHEACQQFSQQIRAGGLASITRLAEGASVLISVHGSSRDIRGELVFLDRAEGYACCDYVDAGDHTTDVLFDGIGHHSEQGPDFGPGDVWQNTIDDAGQGDGRVCIGRAGGTFDVLRKLPLKHLRTDPAWLHDTIELYRTDDPFGLLNAELFRKVVGDFVRDDWAPPCYAMLRELESVLSATLEEAVSEHPCTQRFPLLRNLLETTTSRVLSLVLEDARHQIKEHLSMEEDHPYTQDQILEESLREVRYRHLQKDLELQLRLDQEGVVFDTSALQSVLDRTFEKHRCAAHGVVAEQLETLLGCYGRVATQRVLDRTPQICWKASRTLAAHLREALGGVTDEELARCIAQSPGVLRNHRELLERRERLRKALEAVVGSAASPSGMWNRMQSTDRSIGAQLYTR